MENIKTSSVKVYSAENMGSCDDVQSIDGIIHKLLNDTDVKSKKNTKIETVDDNKMREKEIRAPNKRTRVQHRQY